MAEYPRQADHLQRAVFQGQLEALGQAFQRFCLRRLVDGHLPQLAVSGAVEFAWLAKGLQLLGRALDASALLADQVQLAASQARCQGVEQIGGQLAGFGQEQHGAFECCGRGLDAVMAAACEAAFEHGLIAGMPGPGLGLRQLAEQVVGGGAGDQQRPLKQLCLTEQHFTARVHGRRLLEKSGAV
ncbi:hypothetical protein D3C81_1245020 [compost metagenome]